MRGPLQLETSSESLLEGCRINRQLATRRLKRSAGLGAAALMLMLAPAAAQTHHGPTSVAPLAEKLIDAVVNISTSQTVKGPEGAPLPRVPKGAPFEEFFEDFFNRKGGKSPTDRKVSSLGSGFVIDGKEGIVVTNNHVIDGADEIIINFNDGSKLKVDKVIGKDTKTDLAVLKVTPKKPLPAVPFGSSEKLKVGDWVMAIGNPFGLGGSVTVGIISAKQRDINSGPYDDYLQTDASINKGNSGGPLFNMDGEVIGVNTAIISPSGGSIGIGFSVPSDTAMVVIDQLRQFGETRRGWLGVKVQSLTDDLAETYGVKENTGALVAGGTPDSPAAAAGLKPSDVILKFDGEPVETMRNWPRAVASAPVGKAVDVEVQRAGEVIHLTVTIGRVPEDVEKAEQAEADAKADTDEQDEGEPDHEELLGLSIAPLTDTLRTQFHIGKGVEGVVITDVDANSPAAQKDVKPGDVIVEVTQEKVNDPEEVVARVAAVKKSGRKSVLLLI